MESYKKLSEYDIRNVLSMTDLFPTLVDNGDGTFTNKVTPLSAIRSYSAVPSGGTTSQVLQKTSNTDYATNWHTLAKADVGLSNVDNTTDVSKPVSTATTAAITAATQALYPVGSIYINATSSTNPGTLLGFGTWTAFGAGQVPVGYSSGDADFGTIGQTGGAKTVTLTSAQIPSHNHRLQMAGGGAGVPEWAIPDTGSGLRNWSTASGVNTSYKAGYTDNNTGGDGAHNNLQPYITVYMWKRTA